MYKIAVIGQQCSGKTTAANFFAEHFTHVYRHKIADPIYAAIAALNKPKHRAFMQEFGDLAKKHFGNEIFAEIFEHAVTEREVEVTNMENINAIDRPYPAPDNVLIVCDDVRFQFELDRAKKMGFKIVSIWAAPEVRKARSEAQGFDFIENHNSETEIPSLIEQADFIIWDKDGISMETLKEHCDNILRVIDSS
jgi:dephospho-CoA kinase